MDESDGSMENKMLVEGVADELRDLIANKGTGALAGAIVLPSRHPIQVVLPSGGVFVIEVRAARVTVGPIASTLPTHRAIPNRD